MNASLVAQAKTQPSPTTFIKRHAVAIYYLLTFAISWGGILVLVGGPDGIPGNARGNQPADAACDPVHVLGRLAG